MKRFILDLSLLPSVFAKLFCWIISVFRTINVVQLIANEMYKQWLISSIRIRIDESLKKAWYHLFFEILLISNFSLFFAFRHIFFRCFSFLYHRFKTPNETTFDCKWIASEKKKVYFLDNQTLILIIARQINDCNNNNNNKTEIYKQIRMRT